MGQADQAPRRRRILAFFDPEPDARSCAAFPASPKSPLRKRASRMEWGSLSQRIHTEALVQFVQDLCSDGINEQKIEQLKSHTDAIIPLNHYIRHMSSRIFPKMEPILSLESL